MTNPKRVLAVTANKIAVSFMAPDDVLMHFDVGQELGLVGVDLALRMTPTEARRIAQLLNSKADAAEDGLHRC